MHHLETTTTLRRGAPSSVAPVPTDRDGPSPSACADCGFTPPAPGDTADALRELPGGWRDALRRDSSFVEPAARLRDEIHAVTNRVDRIMAAPGSHLARVIVHTPTALATPTSEDLLIRLLHLSADRLADLIESLPPGAWEIGGRVAGGPVTVRELVQVPLHHSHRDLARSGAGDPVVIHFDRHRRKQRR